MNLKGQGGRGIRCPTGRDSKEEVLDARQVKIGWIRDEMPNRGREEERLDA